MHSNESERLYRRRKVVAHSFKKTVPIPDKLFLMQSLSTLIKGFLAGLMLAFSGAIYLSANSKYIGAALFSIGFFVIFSYGFTLFTGRIGYAVVQNRRKNIQLIPAFLGNIIGALAVGYLIRLTRLSSRLSARAVTLSSDTLSDGVLSLFILSLLCGLLMFVTEDNFKNATNNAQKYLSIIIPVMVIVLCNLELGIVNIFYFSLANVWNFKAVLYILIITAGNSAGAIIIPLCHKIIGKIRAAVKQS